MDRSRFGSREKARFCLPTRAWAVMYLPSTPIRTYSRSSTIMDSWEANGKVPVSKQETKKGHKQCAIIHPFQSCTLLSWRTESFAHFYPNPVDRIRHPVPTEHQPQLLMLILPPKRAQLLPTPTNSPTSLLPKYSNTQKTAQIQSQKKCQVLLSVNIWTAFWYKNITLQIHAISPVFLIPIGTVVSVLRLVPIKKSPISAGLSYTQDGNTGMGWPEFFLFCLSRRIFRVSSRGCWKKRERERKEKIRRLPEV